MALVGQNQQTLFSSPSNGDTPMDATVVKSNDNALRSKHNTHDADATIHVQTGLLASRPAASTPFAMYIDENRRVYADNGSTWVEVPYALLSAAVAAFANNVTIGGSLVVTGPITAGSISAPTTVAAANVTSGNFPSGNYVFPANLGVLGAIALTGSITSASGGVSVGGIVQAGAFTGSGIWLTLGRASIGSGNGAITLQPGGSFGKFIVTAGATTVTLSTNITYATTGREYTVEYLQDATGGWGITHANVQWGVAGAPTITTTANTKTIIKYLWLGDVWFGWMIGTGVASTG